MKVCVIGLGYVGLPAALLIAESGHQVIGVDVNLKVLSQLQEGKVHFEERGIQSLLERNQSRLVFSSEVVEAEVYVIAVPTPHTADHKADLSFVEAATKSILPFIGPRRPLVVLESTVPPLTTEKTVRAILENSVARHDEDFLLAYCPERVLPGNALYEMKNNARCVGGCSVAATEAALAFYDTFLVGSLVGATAREAELAKLCENTYRDVNIAFANEVDAVCRKLGVDSAELIRLANMHPRVNILQPGPGVGGHCIPVDPYFLIEQFPEEAHLIAAARKVNSERPLRLVRDLMSHLSTGTVVVLGLSYKPDVGDIRESPSFVLIDELIRLGFIVRSWDPHVCSAHSSQVNSKEEVLQGCDAVVCMVRHAIFLDDSVFLNGLKEIPVVMDPCGLLGMGQVLVKQALHTQR